MAELGNFFASETPQDINVDMLDYGFVSNCSDSKKLQGILDLLRSGKEGNYPDLERHTEEKLLSLLPVRERNRIIRLKHKTTVAEIQEAELDIDNWSSLQQKQEQELKARASEKQTAKKLPPVRGSKNVSYTSTEVPKSTATKSVSYSSDLLPEKNSDSSSENKPKRISGYDFRSWERYDVDKAAAAVDDEEQLSQQNKQSAHATQEKLKTEKLLQAARRHTEELERIRNEIGANEMSDMKRKVRAGHY